MRTNLVIDDKLVEQAFKYTNVKTKRDLVDLVLREFIINHQKRDVRELRGAIKIASNYDHKKLRTE